MRIDLSPTHATVSDDDGGGAVEFRGLQAALLWRLAQSPDPVHRDTICEWLWRARDRAHRNGRFFALALRLRNRLAEHGLRAELVRSVGDGLWELDLQEGDQLVRA